MLAATEAAMTRVISVHEYELRPEWPPEAFERAIRDAEQRGLFDLPGLAAHYFLRGLKGQRRGPYAAIGLFDSAEAWEALWGPVDDPRPPDDYPERWEIWVRE